MIGTIEKDVPRIAALMAGDVVFLVAGHPPMRGRKTFLEGLEGNVGPGEFSGLQRHSGKFTSAAISRIAGITSL